jgi:hypothetical protein
MNVFVLPLSGRGYFDRQQVDLVRIRGLEPLRLAALPPQSSVSANSTICAQRISAAAIQRTDTSVIFSGSGTTVKDFWRVLGHNLECNRRSLFEI